MTCLDAVGEIVYDGNTFNTSILTLVSVLIFTFGYLFVFCACIGGCGLRCMREKKLRKKKRLRKKKAREMQEMYPQEANYGIQQYRIQQFPNPATVESPALEQKNLTFSSMENMSYRMSFIFEAFDVYSDFRVVLDIFYLHSKFACYDDVMFGSSTPIVCVGLFLVGLFASIYRQFDTRNKRKKYGKRKPEKYEKRRKMTKILVVMLEDVPQLIVLNLVFGSAWNMSTKNTVISAASSCFSITLTFWTFVSAPHIKKGDWRDKLMNMLHYWGISALLVIFTVYSIGLMLNFAAQLLVPTLSPFEDYATLRLDVFHAPPNTPANMLEVRAREVVTLYDRQVNTAQYRKMPSNWQNYVSTDFEIDSPYLKMNMDFGLDFTDMPSNALKIMMLAVAPDGLECKYANMSTHFKDIEGYHAPLKDVAFISFNEYFINYRPVYYYRGNHAIRSSSGDNISEQTSGDYDIGSGMVRLTETIDLKADLSVTNTTFFFPLCCGSGGTTVLSAKLIPKAC